LQDQSVGIVFTIQDSKVAMAAPDINPTVFFIRLKLRSTAETDARMNGSWKENVQPSNS
jgi:hypothetical protein